MIEIKKVLKINGFTVEESIYGDLLLKNISTPAVTMGSLIFPLDKKTGKVEIQFTFDKQFTEGIDTPESLTELQEKIIYTLASDIRNNIEDICGGGWI